MPPHLYYEIRKNFSKKKLAIKKRLLIRVSLFCLYQYHIILGSSIQFFKFFIYCFYACFSGTIWNVGFTHIFDFSIKIDYGNDIHVVPVNQIIRNETISFDVPFRVLQKKTKLQFQSLLDSRQYHDKPHPHFFFEQQLVHYIDKHHSLPLFFTIIITFGYWRTCPLHHLIHSYILFCYPL